MKNLFELKANKFPANFQKTNELRTILKVIFGSALIIAPMLAFGSVEGSLSAVQDKLVGTLLPLAAMCGLVVAGLSFVMGHPSARQHLIYAIVGAIVGFGAESIVSLIRGLIH